MLGAGAEGGAVRRDPLLPRPMAVYRELGGRGAAPECAEGERVIEVLFRVVGRGTALLADLRELERISLVGPLGRGFAQVEADHALSAQSPARIPGPTPDPAPGPAILVGGGTGIASLYEWARELVARGRVVTVLLGARSAGDLLGWSDFEALGVELVGATEDGSVGVKGLVTVPLADRLRESTGATVYAVGPTPMMRACADLAASSGALC